MFGRVVQLCGPPRWLFLTCLWLTYLGGCVWFAHAQPALVVVHCVLVRCTCACFPSLLLFSPFFGSW